MLKNLGKVGLICVSNTRKYILNLDLLAWAHAQAIDKVLKKIGMHNKKIKIIIDEFDKMKTERRLTRVIKGRKLTVVQRARAEENTAVAAASIIAREMREMWIDDASQKYKQDLRSLSLQNAKRVGFINEIAKIKYLEKLQR